jgi:hypothetical protein
MVVALLAVFVAITIGLFLVPGIGLLALIPLAVALVVGVWVALTFRAGTTPANAVRRTKRQELLGPGGPDDPDRAR